MHVGLGLRPRLKRFTLLHVDECPSTLSGHASGHGDPNLTTECVPSLASQTCSKAELGIRASNVLRNGDEYFVGVVDSREERPF